MYVVVCLCVMRLFCLIVKTKTQKKQTLSQLINEINSVAGNDTNTKVGWKQTSLRDAVETFRNTFLNAIKQNQIQKMQN